MNDKPSNTQPEIDVFKSVDRRDPKGRLPDPTTLGLPRLPEVLSIGRDRSKLGHRGKYNTRGSTAKE